ncbi:class I SAM-dependent methyltransferase [Lunatimonas salinarum]|uniref:class I SAM-dependent methyltransferase n=1 Tax=Lunatimonas salinarum TaxID=1774590 RepID=UPI001FD80534|nr:class I SAM-dependent methyltransferase [Lunatimonas salinarum]
MVVKDHAISQESFTLCRCTECGLIFTNPRPDKDHIQSYYDSKDYISHADKSNNLINILYKIVRKYTNKQKINFITKKLKRKGRILDYGCGTGYFISAAAKKGWETVGYEPNTIALDEAKKRTGKSPISDLAILNKEKKFDAITLFHVLEHIHDLNKTIKLILNLLKKRGLLFIAIPNLNSIDFKQKQENWAALDVPRHLYHFNPDTMTYLANQYGLKIVEIKPMVFDAYYVALLTDKYLGRKNPLRSFIDAYRYNQEAKKQQHTHSSLLYILKKK